MRHHTTPFKRHLRLMLFFAIIGLGSCQEEDCCFPRAGEQVEFQLLKYYSTKPGTHSEIATAITTGKSFISYDEIDSYDESNYTFTIDREVLSRVREITEPTPFAVVVDRQVVYTGFFWPSFMSIPCDCLRIDPLATSDQLKVELGYAALRDLSHLDHRNEKVLLGTLQRDGKLK